MWTPPPPIKIFNLFYTIPLYTPEAPYSRGPQTPLSVPESQEGAPEGAPEGALMCQIRALSCHIRPLL